MPTPKTLYRTYCKTCQGFTIHNSEYICEFCDTEFTSYFTDEVEETLILKQRKRYKDQKMQEFGGIYGAFMQGNGINALMQDFEKSKIIECDAGQKEIDSKRKEQRETVKRKG